MVLGLDDAVGCAAFAGDVAVKEWKSALLKLFKTENSIVAIGIVEELTGRPVLPYRFPFWRLFLTVRI